MSAKRSAAPTAGARKPALSKSLDWDVIDEGAGACERIDAVLARARQSGWTTSKSTRISGRVSPELVARAKAQTGITSDSALVEFALANIAVEDEFLEVFRSLKGTVDPALDLEF